MDKNAKSLRRITREFIAKYGAQELRRLLARFSDRNSGTSIANDFHMSRERVRQLKNIFGESKATYVPIPKLSKILDAKRERVEQNFIRTYGQERFLTLIERLSNGDSVQSIADDFDVSRERVHQWRDTFGEVVVTYEIAPVVLEELRKHGRGDPDPSLVE